MGDAHSFSYHLPEVHQPLVVLGFEDGVEMTLFYDLSRISTERDHIVDVNDMIFFTR